MEENEKNTSLAEAEKTSNDGLGCLFWLYTIVSALIGILWIVWLIQGRPDTWYGKLFRFQWKVIIWIAAVLAVITVVYLALSRIMAIWDKRKKH